MQTITRQDRQTLFDIAVQHCGDAQAAFDIADMNDISLTDSETMVLEIPAVYNRRVVDYYHTNDIKPATADNSNENVESRE